MHLELPATVTRPLKNKSLQADFAVVGGGIAGSCAAIAAAREGLKVVLVQDRPVLGGNGSSEVRLWWLGATCHGHTNNRWAREPGIVNELMLENLYLNPDGNPVLVDLVLLDAVKKEPNLTLLLNTAVDGVEKSDPDTISGVTAFCSQNSTRYNITASLFCDASGDGTLGFMAGAAFRMGAEKPEEFGELLAPSEEFGELLGNSIYFYTKDAGHPVSFEAPSFAKKIRKEDIRMLRYFNLEQQGCQLWWIESGGRSDTVHDAERIKWDLWSIAYGIWDYIKNSEDFPDAAQLTLEWVGSIPGKRESRRFEGDYLLTQRDIVHATPQPDTVGFGGWAIDLHPADGAFSKLPSAIQYLTRRLYPIPYRCLYSRNIRNLFLGGRTMSVSHVAFGSTRVMATLGQLGEVIGKAAALGHAADTLPAGVAIEQLQIQLLRAGFHLPGIELPDSEDLAQQAKVTATSSWQPKGFSGGDTWLTLEKATAQMLPLSKGPIPNVRLEFRAKTETKLQVEWRVPSLPNSQAPDLCLGTSAIALVPGDSSIEIAIDGQLPISAYAYLVLRANRSVAVRLSDQQATGLLRLQHHGEQGPGDCHGDHLSTEEAGCERFELWFREGRPALQKNLALQLDRPLHGFASDNVLGNPLRPTTLPNAWVADPSDSQPEITLSWKQAVTIRHIALFLDPDWDHPLETVIKQHPFRTMPTLIQCMELYNEEGVLLGSINDNRQATCTFVFDKAPIITSKLTIRFLGMNGPYPAALFGVRIW